MITENEIYRLAEEYADAIVPGLVFGEIARSYHRSDAIRVLRWLMRKHCIVSMADLRSKYTGIRTLKKPGYHEKLQLMEELYDKSIFKK